jgi:putative ABC transport system substrate-binding protein
MSKNNCLNIFSVRRRLLLASAAWPALVWTGAVFGQSRKPPVLVGWLGASASKSGAPGLTAFKEGLAELGWREGQQYVIEVRWAEGRTEKVQSLADELVAKRPNIIVTDNRRATLAAADAAKSVPIVQANGGSPVDVGLAKSLARPGGMVTGLTNLTGELPAKYLELLLEAVPKLKRVGFLIDRSSPGYAAHMKNARSSIMQYRVDARVAEVAKAEDIEPAVARLAKEGMEALVLLPSAGVST